MIETALHRFEDERISSVPARNVKNALNLGAEIFPYTIYCVKCQSAAESKSMERTGRRNLTDFSA